MELHRFRAATAVIDPLPLPPSVAMPVDEAAPADDNENSTFAPRGAGGGEMRNTGVPG